MLVPLGLPSGGVGARGLHRGRVASMQIPRCTKGEVPERCGADPRRPESEAPPKQTAQTMTHGNHDTVGHGCRGMLGDLVLRRAQEQGKDNGIGTRGGGLEKGS